MNIKIEELLSALNRKEEEKEKNTVLWVLAIIGAVAAVAGIAFAVYHFFAPDYLEDFEVRPSLQVSGSAQRARTPRLRLSFSSVMFRPSV